jgi:hypothetical protein
MVFGVLPRFRDHRGEKEAGLRTNGAGLIGLLGTNNTERTEPMLDRTPNITLEPSLQPRTLTGQSLAKKHRSVRERARIGALWVTGGLYLKPTTKLAAAACQCSAQLVAEEITKIETAGKAPVSLIDTVFGALSLAEQETFVRRHLDSLWRALERVTA